MIVQSMLRWGAAVAAVPVIGILAGCSGHVEINKTPSSSSSTTTSTKQAVPEVDKETLEASAKKQLQAKVTDPIDSVDCDGGLPAKVDAVQTCTVTMGEDKYHATITATEVNGTNVKFHISIPPGQGKSGGSSAEESPTPSPAN